MCTPRYEFYGKKCGEVFFATSVIVVQLVVAGSRCQLAVLLCCWQLRTRLNYVVDHCWSCALSLIACDLAPLRCFVMMFFLLFLMTHCEASASQGTSPCQTATWPDQLHRGLPVSTWSMLEHLWAFKYAKTGFTQMPTFGVQLSCLESLETPWVVSQRSLLTAADLMKQTSDLTQMQTKAWSKQSTP